MDICKSPTRLECRFNTTAHKKTDKIQRIEKLLFPEPFGPANTKIRRQPLGFQRIDALA